MSDLDVEIRRAVVELRSAAPRALSVDDLRDRPVAAVRRPVGGVPVRAFAVAAAVVLLVGGLYAVRRVVDARDVTPGTASSSTAPDATSTSGSSTSAAVVNPPAAILEEPFVPSPVAYGPAARSWLAVVAPLLPEGFHPVLAWSWPTFNSSAYVEAVADDGRWLTVDVGVGGGATARREISGVGDPTAWHSVPEGDLQRHDGGADLVTPAGDVVQVVCRRGAASCAPGADALAALVQGAARAMDREQVRVTDVDAAGDPMPSVTCAQLSVAPSLRALRQLSEVGEPRRAVPCQWDGPSFSLIFVDVALRAAPQGTAFGIRRAALRDGIAVNGQGSGSDGFVSVTATIGNGQPIDSGTAAVLATLIDHITIDLIGETGALADAVRAGTSAPPGATPATAASVPTAPPDPCADRAARPGCDGAGTTATTAVPTTYTVVAGDYLVGIAQKLGVPFVDLLTANNMTTESLITAGQHLRVPTIDTARTFPRHPASWRPSGDDPARVYVASDSSLDGLAPRISILAVLDRSSNDVTVRPEAHPGSGLARPDAFDWSARVAVDLASLEPDVSVVALGGNDTQGLLKADGTVISDVADPAWAAEYSRRAGALLDRLVADGRPLVWVGAPMARDDAMNTRLSVIRSVMLAVVARHSGATYIDAWTLFAGRDGGYADTISIDGHDEVVRQPDGFHLDDAGDDYLAVKVNAAVAAALAARTVEGP